MKVVGVISTTALFLLLGATVPALAQEEHHEQEAKPAQQQEKAKPPQQQEQAKPAKQEEQAKPEKQQQQQDKATKQEPQQQAKGQQEQTKSNNQQQQHANGQQHQQHAQRAPDEARRQSEVPALRLSARGEGRMPDDRFRSNFGEQHTFVINDPVMVGGYSRFQYGGYWFGFVQPWPVDWYYTDDVYVEYIDGGYYLCNPYYPGARVSISVVM
jgi:flagellar motor protein MotB